MKSALLVVVLACSTHLPAQNQDATFVNGVDGYINIPATGWVGVPAITVEAWVFFNNVGLNPTNLYPTVIRKNVAPGQEEFFIRVQGTGALRWKVKTGAATSVTVDTPTPMAGGVWTHVAGTHDGSVARLYLNGVQVAQATGAGTPFNGGGGIRIGKGDDQAGLPSEVWSGRIDELRIWSVARTAAQIQATMNWELPAVPNLVSSYRMTGSGIDWVGPNPGTVVGSVTFGPSTLALNNGPAPWQVNQPAMSLDVDTISSDGYTPAIIAPTFTSCTAANMTVNLNSNLTGSPWDVGLTLGPGVPGNAGGIMTPGGQAVNLPLLDPTFTFLFFPNPSPPLSSVSIPLSFTTPFSISAQAFTITPSNPDGFALSSLVQIAVAAGASSIPGPTLGDSVVTVQLSNPAFCGAPPALAFYGTSYTQFDVSSNGRVMFGWPAPNTAFTPSVAAAQTGYGFVGAWCDLAPNQAGTITISVPATNFVRVDYTGVRFFAVNAFATFGVAFDGTTGAVVIDGLGGIPVAAVSQFLGITAGLLGPATNPGATAFALGGPFPTAAQFDMIYAFGTSGSLATGLSAIVFLPSTNGGYDWYGI